MPFNLFSSTLSHVGVGNLSCEMFCGVLFCGFMKCHCVFTLANQFFSATLLCFLSFFLKYLHFRATVHTSTVTVFVIKALIRDQSDGSVITPSEKPCQRENSHVSLHTQHLMKLELERDVWITGFVSVKTRCEAVSVYCLVDGMIGGEMPTPKSRCKNLIAGTTCIPRRSLLHFQQEKQKINKKTTNARIL